MIILKYREPSENCLKHKFVQGTFTHTISVLYKFNMPKAYHFEGHFALVDLLRRSGLQNVDHLAEVDPILQCLLESLPVRLRSRRKIFSGNFCQPCSYFSFQVGVVLSFFLYTLFHAWNITQHTRREKVAFYIFSQFSCKSESPSPGSFRHRYWD